MRKINKVVFKCRLFEKECEVNDAKNWRCREIFYLARCYACQTKNISSYRNWK
jgi:hypothetical protein